METTNQHQKSNQASISEGEGRENRGRRRSGEGVAGRR